MLNQKKILLFSLLCMFIITAGLAQEKSLTEQLKESLQKKYASLSILVRNIADFQAERSLPGTNGFYIENFRVKLSGELDDRFGYSLETKLINSPAILDAKLYYEFSPQLKLDFGLFKLPFSSEYLVSEADIDFVYRSQTVNALNVGKQVGVMVSGESNNKLFTYAAGIFNGNKGAKENDNNKFLYVGRITFRPVKANDNETLEIGFSTAQSRDKAVIIMDSTFEGDRFLIGGDINFSVSNFQLYSEVIAGRLKSISGSIKKPVGCQVTAGYYFTKKMLLLVRWDSFMENRNLPFNNLAILGFNIIPSGLFKFQLNYLIPVNDGKIKHHQFLFNTQFSF